MINNQTIRNFQRKQTIVIIVEGNVRKESAPHMAKNAIRVENITTFHLNADKEST